MRVRPGDTPLYVIMSLVVLIAIGLIAFQGALGLGIGLGLIALDIAFAFYLKKTSNKKS